MRLGSGCGGVTYMKEDFHCHLWGTTIVLAKFQHVVMGFVFVFYEQFSKTDVFVKV